MKATAQIREITVEHKVESTGGLSGRPHIAWAPIAYLPGSPAVAERFQVEVQDILPSRSESVKQGLAVARNQTRIRMRWRADIDSAMRFTLHGDSDVVYQIIAGPVEIGGRKDRIEFIGERVSS